MEKESQINIADGNNQSNDKPAKIENLLKEVTKPNNYKTFNRIKELQVLIKRESALKELCKNILYKVFVFCFSFKISY